MRLSPYLCALMLVFSLGWACSLFGQGVGTPSGNGLVPRIEFDHRAVGDTNEMHVRGCAPHSTLFLFIAHSEAPTPLAAAGLGPAVLGPDLMSPNGAVSFSHLTTNHLGEFNYAFAASPAIIDLEVNLQAACLDFGAPFGGIAFSEHRRFYFGFERSFQAIAAETGAGFRTIVEVFSMGRLASPGDPRLSNIDFADLTLTNSNEQSTARRDRPTLDRHAEGAARIRLPGDFSLIGVRSANFEDGLVLRHPNGRTEVLVWRQGTATEPAIVSEVAASAFDRWVAVLTEPSNGDQELLLVRVDGWNATPSHEKSLVIPTPLGLDIDQSSLCFLDGALLFGDGESELWRFDLNTRLVSQVIFPNSGGMAPAYLDESYAPAEDGSAMALGAGQSDILHDIYVVSAAGVATNLSNFPAEYEDAGPAAADGIQLAMSADGAWVAYMRVELTTETYVQGTAPMAPPQQVTTCAQFIDSIDTVIGVGFRANGKAVFVAGKELNEADLYRFDPSTTQVSNITQTSGISAPIFDLGADLQFVRRFSTPEYLVSEMMDPLGERVLVLTDNAGDSQIISTGVPKATIARDDGALIADMTAAGVFCVRRIPASPGMAPPTLWLSGANSVFLGQGHHRPSDRSAFLVQQGTTTQMITVDPVGVAVAQPGPTRAPTGQLALDGMGRVVALTLDPSGTMTFVESWDPLTQSWTTDSGPFPTATLGIFLD